MNILKRFQRNTSPTAGNPQQRPETARSKKPLQCSVSINSSVLSDDGSKKSSLDSQSSVQAWLANNNPVSRPFSYQQQQAPNTLPATDPSNPLTETHILIREMLAKYPFMTEKMVHAAIDSAKTLESFNEYIR